MGTATAIPSGGILCMAMAAVMGGIATSIEVSADIKVAIPSGKL